MTALGLVFLCVVIDVQEHQLLPKSLPIRHDRLHRPFLNQLSFLLLSRADGEALLNQLLSDLRRVEILADQLVLQTSLQVFLVLLVIC